jgi:hypothetical protein
MTTKNWSLQRSQRELMACKYSVVCEILSNCFTQVSLGLLPTGTFAAMFPTECAAHFGGITRNVG